MAQYYPLEGASMKSLVRGSSSESQSFNIQPSDFLDALYLGYFKFNTIDTTKNYSLMKLQISSESYTFLHLYINTSQKPTIKIIFDQQNASETFSLSTSISNGQWNLLGIGYKYATKNTYLIYQNSINYVINMQSKVNGYGLASIISQLELCVSCKPLEYLYTQFNGMYSSIKMLTQFELSTNSKFFLNEFEMSSNLLRESFQKTANLITFAQSKNSNFSLICSSPSKIFFDGFCIDNTACQNVQYFESNQFGNLNSFYWNSNLNECNSCDDNCSICNLDATCQQCNYGYILVSNQCKRCQQGYYFDQITKSCGSTCPSGYQQDDLNQMCVLSFNIFYHQLNSLLVKRSFNQNDEFKLIDSSTQTLLSNKFTQCYLENNSYGPYTFLGGYTTLKTEQLTKILQGMPRSPKKIIQFQFLIYNSGSYTDLNLKVNNRVITLTSYKSILSSQTLCTDNQIVSLYQLTYDIYDSSVDFNIIFTSNVDGWGIRNFSMNITKCHPTCLDCSADNYPWQCSTCEKQSNTLYLNNQCACSKGQYAAFQNCYSSPCYQCQSCPSNCITCEDLTGKCTSCNSGFSIQDGLCLSQSNCSGSYIQDSQTSYCIQAKDKGLSHFGNDKIVQYLDFWQYSYSPLIPQSCFSRQFAPTLQKANNAKLVTSLQNYMNYHYMIEVTLTATNIDYISISDYIKYSIDNVQIKSANYNVVTSLSYCESSIYGEKQQNEVLTSLKSDSNLILNIESQLTTVMPISSNKYTFNDLIINYNRCHASCSKCSNASDKCSNCIDNASLNASKGTLCYCKDGFYFTYDWKNSSGLCLKCNSSCKTCNGPQITDCLTCQDGYQTQSGLCVNQCQANQYWDKTLNKCLQCSDCCQTCSGSTQNDCLTCNTNVMSYTQNKCYFKSDGNYCTSCQTFSGGYCGGTSTNHQYCLTKGWILHTSSICIQCSTVDSSSQCGGSSSNNTICNQQGYFYSSSQNQCLYCAVAVGTECGDVSIRSVCKLNQWIYSISESACINCILLPSHPLCASCDPSCQTCFGPKADNCSSCISSKIIVNHKCLDSCPNGYKQVSGSCILCSNPNDCLNCSITCETCDSSNTSLCKTCYSSRNIDASKVCQCNDPEDMRNNFYECSLNNQAILDIKLSNSMARLTIEFGKQLEDLPSYPSQESSSRICSEIFDDDNLKLIGIYSNCQIKLNQIIIDLDDSSSIMGGDELNFKPAVLKFKTNSSVYIDTFLNNIAVQEPPINPIIEFSYKSVESSCYDYRISLKNIDDYSKQRGFKSLKWTLINPSSDPDDTQIVQILDYASQNKQSSIIISKGVIKIDTLKTIKLEYKLKNSFENSQVFTFMVKNFKSIKLDIQSNLKSPYYRFQEFIVSLVYTLDYCDADGNYIAQNSSNFDIQVTSPQSTSININEKSYTKNEISFVLNKYTFSPNVDIEINVIIYKNLSIIFYLNLLTLTKQAIVSFSSDPLITSNSTLQLKFDPSQLITKIIGGDRKIDYRNKLTFSSEVRDLDIQDSTANQQIITTWECYDPADISKVCTYQDGQIINLNTLSPKEIPGGTFNPYTAIKIQLNGQKDTRTNSHSVIIFFLEFDLPNLDVSLTIIDPFQKTVNLNEEIFAVLDYDKTVNTDILSFSSTIVYDNTVVGAIKFDYTKLRFQLWDYHSSFSKTNPSLQIRFSVFNPYFFMPSSQIINIQINFPPEYCVFQATPQSNSPNPPLSLSTVFLLTMSGCQDLNQPITYQYFMYLSQADLDYEIKNPKQIKRRQLSSQSEDSFWQTNLPAGDLILMAVATDSLQAVYNTTIPIKVASQNLNENQYISIIDSILKSAITNSDEIIFYLSIVAEDLCKRTDMSTSTLISAKKLQMIDALKTASSTLSVLSTFSTLADKTIASLYQSGIQLTESQEKQQLNQLKTALSDNWQTIPYEQLTDVQKIIKQQQIFDSFLMIDKLASNSKQDTLELYNLQVDITKSIADKMNYYSLPNEDSRLFKGNKLDILSQQVTDKNLCNYLFCNSQSIDTSGTPSIYNVVYKTHYNNPYSQDDSYKNFTLNLTENLGIKNPTKYPIVVPSITQKESRRILSESRVISTSNSPITQNSIQLTFAGEEQQNIACLTKSNNKWKQNGCKLIYNKKNKLYTCICDEPNPTTIVDDLEALITNKNLQTAFGSQGLENLSNFTNFYEYVAFWLIVFNTICYLILYIKGKNLDSIQDKIIVQPLSNKVYPESMSNNHLKVQNNNNYKESCQNIIQPSNYLSQPTTTLEFKSKEFRPRKVQASNRGIKSQKIMKIETQEKSDGVYNDISPLAILDQNDLNNLQSQQKANMILTESHNKEMKIIERQPSIIDHMKLEGKNSEQEIKDDKQQGNIENLTQNKLPTTSIQSLKFIELSDDEYNQKKRKFLNLNPIKQMIYFHNFFGIFLVYNHEMPRTLRFSCFYVRLIHSFAISIVFDQSYNFVQLIFLSLANSAVIIIFLQLLEILNKKLGRYALAFVLLSLLGFYYYIILSIVSGQESSQSNISMISYIIFTLGDLLVISFVSATVQRFIALSTMRKSKLQSCSQKIFEFLHIQLILKSIL